MDYRSVKDIEEEISEVNNLMNPLKEFLLEHPNDLAVKGNLNSLKGRYEELIRELGFAKNYFGVTSFDIHITDKSSKKVGIKQLGDICLSFQELIDSCSMFDGNKPVKKGAGIDLEIKENVNLQVDAISIGSLNILVSPKNNQSTFLYESYLKRGLKQINRIIDCGEDKDKITTIMKEIGTQPIYKYKKLLDNLKKDELDLDIYYSVIPKGFEKRTLTSEFATKVHTIIDESYEEETNTIEVFGMLYYVNVKSKKCGIDIKEGDLEKNKTITIKFRDSFKSILKESLDSDISVVLERTIKYNSVEESSQDIFNLIKII